MSSSPTGTVTFLFTDIEGSTRRWDSQAEAMKAALARHNIILRSSIEAHGGHVFGTAGDSFCASFPIASDALAAALAAQRGLATETWGETGELRVRMALNTGPVRENDYFAPPLNRVARLLSAAHGGQVLLSHGTADLVQDHLPEGVQLRDLGTHGLRDLSRPEQIFQVVAPPLPAEFAPLKTLDARPNNLQAQPTPLLGRSEDVKKICARFRDEGVRLLTLTGPGGTGKSRLGLQAAANLMDDYKDGVYFVALAPLSDPALVISTIAQTLGLKEAGGRSILLALQEYLRNRETLLVLDNFEQVTAAAPEVAELLANSVKLRVIVTSRIPLHLQGEHEFAVQPLALPDYRHLPAIEALSQYAAVRLFVERALAVKSDFAVNNDNAPAVAEICVRLDGLPLAIELAAARVKLLSPQAMLARLKDPLKFLTGGARELTARQQTLRGAIAWSHDLLDENEKRLFRRLGVFVGGCTLESVEPICNANGDLGVDVFEGIASLVDKSLLKQIDGPDSEPRFFMLETIREYAQEKLTESGESEELQNWHADYFLTFAEQAENELHGFQQLKWYESLDAEHDNLRAALDGLIRHTEVQRGLRLAGALGDFWYSRGHTRETAVQFEVLFALPGASQPTAARAKALLISGLVFVGVDHAKALSYAEESLQLWKELGDKRGLARAMCFVGELLEHRRELAKAGLLIEQGVAMCRELGDKWLLAWVLVALGGFRWRRGEIAAAREATEESINLCRQVGDESLMAYPHSILGYILRLQGEPEKARSLFEESLAVCRKFNYRTEIASRLSNLAQLAFSVGDYSRVAELAKASIEEYEKMGAFKQWIAEAQFLLGELARRQGDDEGTRAHYSDFLASMRDSSIDYDLPVAFTRVGRVALEDDHFAEARRCLNESMAIHRKLGAKMGIVQALKLIGDVANGEGNREEAERFHAESLALAREAGDKAALDWGGHGAGLQGGVVLGELGQLLLDQCDFAKAFDFWNEQLALSRKLEIKIALAWCPHNLGLVEHYRGRLEEASTLFEEALGCFRALGLTHGIARCLLGRAMVKHAQGDLTKARSLSEESVALFRRSNGADNRSGSRGTKDVAHALQGLVRVALALGDISAASAALKEGLGIAQHRFDKRGIAEGLAGFARLAIAQHNAERAARLFGAAETLHKIVGPRLNPFDHHDHANVVAGLRSTLGDETFAIAWARGRAMTKEQAIAYALEESECVV